MKELTVIQNRCTMQIDETEAYLRHRARVHEREKREKLRKQGKLDEYLAEVERNKPKPEPKKPADDDGFKLCFEKFMQEYAEYKKFEKENLNVLFALKNDVSHKNDEEPKVDTAEKKKKTKRRKKPKKTKNEETEIEVVLNETEFKPQMAGSTGLPSFFFSNLVNQNRAALQEAQAKNKMTFRQGKKNNHEVTW